MGILGHEGGLWLRFLKGWVEALYAGNRGSDDHILYNIQMTLTPEGYTNGRSRRLYAGYIQLVSKQTDTTLSGAKSWRLAFRYSEIPVRGGGIWCSTTIHDVPAKRLGLSICVC